MNIRNIRLTGMVRYFAATIILVMLSASANAASLGTYLGTFSGNDSESALAAALGIDADLIAKVDWPSSSEDGLSISNLTYNDDNEVVAGDWDFSGTDIITHIVIKSGPDFAVYEYTDGLNMGSFDTSGVGNKGLSHITAYSIAKPIPIPGAIWLMAGGLVTLLRRKKS